MVHVSHEIWGIGVVALLIGFLILKAIIRRFNAGRSNPAMDHAANDSAADRDIEHRALMYLMAEKTDSLLSALAKTIEQERQKLGGVVRNPSMEETLDRLQVVPATIKDRRPASYDSIYPMAQQEIDAETIARQLRIPEEEVALVMRLKAA